MLRPARTRGPACRLCVRSTNGPISRQGAILRMTTPDNTWRHRIIAPFGTSVYQTLVSGCTVTPCDGDEGTNDSAVGCADGTRARRVPRNAGIPPDSCPGRRWQLDVVVCTKVFDRLVSEGFLQQTNTGSLSPPVIVVVTTDISQTSNPSSRHERTRRPAYMEWRTRTSLPALRSTPPTDGPRVFR